ncbi:MAG: alkaline phosphatase family protein, partial [Candidatus Geothermarchaeales archaeon]
SFITGRLPHEHGIYRYQYWSNPLIDFFSKLPHRLRLSTWLYRLGRRPIGQLGKLLEKGGYRRSYVGKELLTGPTLFERVRNSVALSVPGYNWHPSYAWLNARLEHALDGRGTGEFIEECWSVYRRRKAELLSLLHQEWTLVVCHFHLGDLLGHLYFSNRPRLEGEVYLEFERLAGQVRKALGERALILIVSDHGMWNGHHTPYGFYSSNLPLGLERPKLTDFYATIVNYVERSEQTISSDE